MLSMGRSLSIHEHGLHLQFSAKLQLNAAQAAYSAWCCDASVPPTLCSVPAGYPRALLHEKAPLQHKCLPVSCSHIILHN